MHMEVKKWLWTQDPETELSRKIVFPIYTDQNRLKKLEQNKYLAEKREIEEKKYTHGTCFNYFLGAIMTGNTAMVEQVLELVEAHYVPRVLEDKESIKVKK